MKAILISLLILVGTQAQAQNAEQDAWMAQELKKPVFAQIQLNSASRNMSALNPLIVQNAGLDITFDTQNVTIAIQPEMPPCEPNMACAQVMPAEQYINLEVVKVEQSGCSIKYYAATPANALTRLYEEVVIEDFTYSICEMVYLNLGKITYKATGYSEVTGQNETAVAEFVVPQFLRGEIKYQIQ